MAVNYIGLLDELAVYKRPLTVDEIQLLARDRGLLAYHLDHFPAALSDLEEYLRLSGPADPEDREREQIWEHVKALRRRVAALN